MIEKEQLSHGITEARQVHTRNIRFFLQEKGVVASRHLGCLRHSAGHSRPHIISCNNRRIILNSDYSVSYGLPNGNLPNVELIAYSLLYEKLSTS